MEAGSKRLINIYWIGAVIIFILIAGAVFIFLKKEKVENKNKVCFNDNCFSVEIAQTPQERSRGLMLRENLEKTKGMLFIFEKEGIYNFWMKDTLVPLDIIWIDENKEVVFIADNVQPCKEDPCPAINSEKEAKYVLEIQGGVSREIGLSPGSKLEL